MKITGNSKKSIIFAPQYKVFYLMKEKAFYNNIF